MIDDWAFYQNDVIAVDISSSSNSFTKHIYHHTKRLENVWRSTLCPFKRAIKNKNSNKIAFILIVY